MLNNHFTTKDITKISIMSALIFVSTYIIKFPSLNGYTHIGDSMIFLAVLLLGKKKGALAAGLGAALSDLLGGYMQYILPTFLIKFIMALIMGIITEKLFSKTKYSFIIGSIIGGAFQVIAYAFVETFMYNFTSALASIPSNTVQSITGVVIATVLVTVLEKSNVLKKLKSI